MKAFDIIQAVEKDRQFDVLDDQGYDGDQIEEIIGIRQRSHVCVDANGEVFVSGEKVEIDEGKIPVFISIYHVDRCYGGPEEGGWWYDKYSLVHSEQMMLGSDVSSFKERMASLKEEYNNEGARPLHSVLSDGLFDVVPELQKGGLVTKGKPQYC